MMQRICPAALFSMFLLLWGAPAVALPKADAPAPPDPIIWMPFGGGVSLSNQHYTVKLTNGATAELGDPKLGRWAEKMSSRVGNMNHADLTTWLILANIYRIEKAEPALMGAAQKLIQRKRFVGDNRDSVFAALSTIATKRSIKKLEKMLEEPIKDVALVKAGGIRSYGHHPSIAAALVRLDQDSGRDYLVGAYRQVLLDMQDNKAVSGGPRGTLERFYDKGLIERIEKLKQDPAITERKMQRNIVSLLERMRINGLPIEKLRVILEDDANDFQTRGRRYDAALAMTERAGTQDIVWLEAVQKKLQANIAEHRMLERAVHKAIVMTRCRLWNQPNEKNPKEPK